LKYGIDIGHNVENDTGAVAIRREDELNMEVGIKVIKRLGELGYTVINCTPTTASSLGDSLNRRVQTANLNNVDVFVSIHFNAGGGRGTEAFAMSDTGRIIGRRVVKQIAALGFVNRGVKDGSWLYVVRNTKAPAILVECAFVDSREDMDRYADELMVNAIVRGLVGEDGDNTESNNPGSNKATSQPTPSNEGVYYLQQVLNRLKIRDYSGAALVEDGVIGPRTSSAVQNFQSLMGLVVDGTAGPDTWNALKSILNKPLLRINNSEETAAKYVQWRTGTHVDGIFGPLTREAVMGYQQHHSLLVDGIVGPQTWRSLIE
jgi:N-acetylmuramoyl-L-alanine amidase